MNYPTMSNEEFRDRIKAIVGPLPRETKPTVRTPQDRGYWPPPRCVGQRFPADVFNSEKTIWNSDGTDGPVLICLPPSESQGEVRP